MNTSMRFKNRKKVKDQGGPRVNGVAGVLFGFLMILATLGAFLLDYWQVKDVWIGTYVAGMTLVSIYFLFALKIASQWEKAVVLRFGKYRGLFGPGLFWLVPVVDTIPEWIDHRVMVTPFSAEKTLTRGWFGMPRKRPWKLKTTRWLFLGPHKLLCEK